MSRNTWWPGCSGASDGRVLGRRWQLNLAFVMVCVLGACGSDWPQFRGPGGSATSSEVGLPVRWSETENVRWKVDLPGRGLTNPVIANGRVFVTACSGYQQTLLHVLCYDQADGKKLWERRLTATGNTACNEKTCMAAPTPVTDGDHVYALFATGDLAAFDREGNLLWYRALARDYPDITNQVGLASSPVLWNDVLLLPLDNDGDSFIAGLDKKTGKNRWRTPRPKDINWTTPLIRTDGERPEAVFLTGRELLAVDPETGERRWSYKGEGLSSAPSPIAVNGQVVLPGGVAIRPGGLKEASKAMWNSAKLRTGFGSFLFYRERIYAINNAGVLNCADPSDGKILWSLRLKGAHSASPVAADGRIYLVNEEGATSVVEAGDQGKLLATNLIGESILATPAIADGAIFLRSDKHLWCIGDKKAK